MDSYFHCITYPEPSVELPKPYILLTNMLVID